MLPSSFSVQSVERERSFGVIYLDEHLGSGCQFGLFDRLAEAAHRLAVARELEREFLLPHGLDLGVAARAQLLLGQAGLAVTVDVHLLAENRQRRLGRLTHLLVHSLRLPTHATTELTILSRVNTSN